MSVKHYIEKAANGEDLTVQEAGEALELIVTNQASDTQIAGLLVALRTKGETVDEVVGFATTMRRHALAIKVDDPHAIDMCGTGGDGRGSFNISTVASFVAAGAGITVAKHGNRSVSSMSGSADLLSSLGVNMQLTPERVQNCINSIGIGFLFAPLFHPAMKTVAKPRRELGIRTIFNMLGPITNPAGVTQQLIGTYAHAVSATLAKALRQLQTRHACVVHSDDGMDEVSLVGETSVFEVGTGDNVDEYTVAADQFGLDQHVGEAARGGDSTQNADIALRILRGERTPARDVVLANAAFGIYVAGKASTLTDATALAAESIDSGRALGKLNDMIAYSNAA
jgi:anthranilate phosphoribosyltransferase